MKGKNIKRHISNAEKRLFGECGKFISQNIFLIIFTGLITAFLAPFNALSASLALVALITFCILKKIARQKKYANFSRKLIVSSAYLILITAVFYGVTYPAFQKEKVYFVESEVFSPWEAYLVKRRISQNREIYVYDFKNFIRQKGILKIRKILGNESDQITSSSIGDKKYFNLAISNLYFVTQNMGSNAGVMDSCTLTFLTPSSFSYKVPISHDSLSVFQGGFSSNHSFLVDYAVKQQPDTVHWHQVHYSDTNAKKASTYCAILSESLNLLGKGESESSMLLIDEILEGSRYSEERVIPSNVEKARLLMIQATVCRNLWPGGLASLNAHPMMEKCLDTTLHSFDEESLDNGFLLNTWILKSLYRYYLPLEEQYPRSVAMLRAFGGARRYNDTMWVIPDHTLPKIKKLVSEFSGNIRSDEGSFFSDEEIPDLSVFFDSVMGERHPIQDVTSAALSDINEYSKMSNEQLKEIVFNEKISSGKASILLHHLLGQSWISEGEWVDMAERICADHDSIGENYMKFFRFSESYRVLLKKGMSESTMMGIIELIIKNGIYGSDFDYKEVPNLEDDLSPEILAESFSTVPSTFEWWSGELQYWYFLLNTAYPMFAHEKPNIKEKKISELNYFLSDHDKVSNCFDSLSSAPPLGITAYLELVASFWGYVQTADELALRRHMILSRSRTESKTIGSFLTDWKDILERNYVLDLPSLSMDYESRGLLSEQVEISGLAPHVYEEITQNISSDNGVILRMLSVFSNDELFKSMEGMADQKESMIRQIGVPAMESLGLWSCEIESIDRKFPGTNNKKLLVRISSYELARVAKSSTRILNMAAANIPDLVTSVEKNNTVKEGELLTYLNINTTRQGIAETLYSYGFDNVRVSFPADKLDDERINLNIEVSCDGPFLIENIKAQPNSFRNSLEQNYFAYGVTGRGVFNPKKIDELQQKLEGYYFDVGAKIYDDGILLNRGPSGGVVITLHTTTNYLPNLDFNRFGFVGEITQIKNSEAFKGNLKFSHSPYQEIEFNLFGLSRKNNAYSLGPFGKLLDARGILARWPSSNKLAQLIIFYQKNGNWRCLNLDELEKYDTAKFEGPIGDEISKLYEGWLKTQPPSS